MESDAFSEEKRVGQAAFGAVILNKIKINGIIGRDSNQRVVDHMVEHHFGVIRARGRIKVDGRIRADSQRAAALRFLSVYSEYCHAHQKAYHEQKPVSPMFNL